MLPVPTTLFPDLNPPPLGAWMCVLASGSGGNCTALVFDTGVRRRVVLIDLGLAPRRTRGHLADLGLGLEDVEFVLLTHLDSDHWNSGWIGKLPAHTTLVLHRRHIRRGQRDGACYQRTIPVDTELDLMPGVRLRTALAAHDELGSSVFRFDFADGRSLGFATDLGRVGQPIVDHLQGVDVLALESNYCPDLQLASRRPEFLKRRVMNGHGHLSNQQCAEAAERIGPRERLILLHLSRECNDPMRAAHYHRSAPYSLTVTSQHTASEIIPICGTTHGGQDELRARRASSPPATLPV